MFIFRSLCVFFDRQWIVSNFLCCGKIHVGRWHLQKKKWTRDTISSLIAWNYETSAILGPRINTKKARSTISRVKRKVVHDVSDNNCQLSADQVAVSTKADELTDGKTHMADVPCSVSRCLSSQTVLEDPIKKLRSSTVKTVHTKKRQKDVSNNSYLSKQKSDDSFLDSTKRKGTCTYMWVSSYPQSPYAKIDGKEEKTLPLFAQNTARNFADYMVQNAEDVSSDTIETAHSDGEQPAEKISATEPLAEEDEAQQTNSNQHVLTFSLFASPDVSSEAVNVSARLPSVSAILKATMPPESRQALNRWEQRMIAELGEDGFKEYQTG